MRVFFTPSKAEGTVKAPPSKSMAHRMLLAAGLADGTSIISNIKISRDIEATIDCLRALGASVEIEGDTAAVTGTDPKNRGQAAVLKCRESGSTIRFFLPLCLLSGRPACLEGTEKLLSRPFSVYENIFNEQGLLFEKTKNAIKVCGPLNPGCFSFRGDISSQFVTGLLYALPVLDGDSTIRLIPPVESRSYIDLSLSALKQFGVTAEWKNETTLYIPGGQRFQKNNASVEGDWSNAVFLEGLNLIGGNVSVTGLKEDSLQGDRVYRKMLGELKNGTPKLDLSDCPDLGPVLFALAAAQNGAVFTGIERLRLKESDRIEAMREELNKFGAVFSADLHSVTIRPGIRRPAAPLFGHNDHRIVMALSLLCSYVGGTIDGAEAVEKSFPEFFERLKELGVVLCELDQQQ